jgi:hypothetical protein
MRKGENGSSHKETARYQARPHPQAMHELPLVDWVSSLTRARSVRSRRSASRRELGQSDGAHKRTIMSKNIQHQNHAYLRIPKNSHDISWHTWRTTTSRRHGCRDADRHCFHRGARDFDCGCGCDCGDGCATMTTTQTTTKRRRRTRTRRTRTRKTRKKRTEPRQWQRARPGARRVRARARRRRATPRRDCPAAAAAAAP